MTSDGYVTDEATGESWRLMLGDSCERLAEIPSDSIDLSVCSPPFASLFTYSPSPRDLGNCSSRVEFLEHYSFIIREQLRVTRPGRVACIHVAQVTTRKNTEGFIGLTDFRGEVIRAFQSAGWIFHGEVTIWKNPQAQATRTKAHSLMFVTKNRDSAGIRPALADYLLIFRKPGDNAVPIPHEVATGEVTNDDWIEWASPIWYDASDGEHEPRATRIYLKPGESISDHDTDEYSHEHDDGDSPVPPGWQEPPVSGSMLGGDHLSPVWTTIRETDTLNERVAREDADERHLCPLQLGFIERCVRLWSNPGETVLTPFAGIGSELHTAVRLGRRAIGIELKPSYWRTAVTYLRRLDAEMQQDTLFGAA
jgi:DNA methylase